jgi:hypothetical protein
MHRGGVFQTNPSRMMATLAEYTVVLLNALDLAGLPLFLSVDGLEIAATEERARDLKRRYGLACSWGIPSELVSPGRCRQLSPLMDTRTVHGGFFAPRRRYRQAGTGLRGHATRGQ